MILAPSRFLFSFIISSQKSAFNLPREEAVAEGGHRSRLERSLCKLQRRLSMALDLMWGIALIMALTAGLFLATATLARHLSHRALSVVALFVVGALLLYIRSLWYDVRLAAWLPFSNLIVLGNWLPLLAAVLA